MDRSSEEWRPEKEGSGRAKRTYDAKAEALKDLRNDISSQGGSVRIQKIDNAIQEECALPRSKDPRRNKKRADVSTHSTLMPEPVDDGRSIIGIIQPMVEG
ncbi:DUF2188 domain-containing protein [Pelagibius sp.]|uniref:DUF2188 domain-containing protein n=1 Tax=Pelagibius sp. TaxID=1931238 RepID=UPI003B50275A